MNARISSFIIIIFGLAAVGCSSSRSISSVEGYSSSKDRIGFSSATPESPGADQAELVMAMSGWLNTPYRYGGAVKSGIDCSAYVQQMMSRAFDVSLPRTTREQMSVGEKVSKDRLQPGDLVFFQTGRNQHHVGIYLSDGEFTHASTTVGVTVSHLNDYYWKDKYLEARRVLERPFSGDSSTIAVNDDTPDRYDRKQRNRVEQERTERKPRVRRTSGTRSSGGTWTAPGKAGTAPRPPKTGW